MPAEVTLKGDYCRRYEWKCDSLNAPSRTTAERLGFSFEGIFREAVVYKGRNRDIARYSVIDTEWPAIKGAFEAWFAPGNFDDLGVQRRSLADLRAAEAAGQQQARREGRGPNRPFLPAWLIGSAELACRDRVTCGAFAGFSGNGRVLASPCPVSPVAPSGAPGITEGDTR